jgi:hypothetical protein
VESNELWSWVTMMPRPGDDLITALRRLPSLSQDMWAEGFGELRDPVVLTQSDQGERTENRLSGVWDVLSIRGTVKAGLYALVASGPMVVGGLLARGQVVTFTLRLGAPQARPPQPLAAVIPAPMRAPQPAPAPAAPPVAPAAPAPAVQVPTSLPGPEASALPPPVPATPTIGQTAHSANANMPKRPVAKDNSVESYPEEGDVVTHFQFGRCNVVYSDGERLRLQQDKDGRVREVALSMLRIGEPSMNEAGRREWELARKN